MWSYSSCIATYMYKWYWLYPLVLFAPMCETLLRTVSTWVYCFTFLVCSLVWESAADCIHMGLLFYSLGFLPCVRVRCGLYPHVECGVLSPRVRVHCRLYTHVECACFPQCELVVRCACFFRQVLTQSFLKDRFEGTLPSNIGMTLLGISLVLLFTLPFYTLCRYSKFWQVPKQT